MSGNINSSPRSSKDNVREHKFNTGSNLDKIQSTEALGKVPCKKSINPCIFKVNQKTIKQSNSFGEKESKGIEKEDKRKSIVTSNKCIQGEHIISKISAKILDNEASDDLMTEANKQKVNEYMDNSNDGHLSDGFDEEDVSDQSICCGSIFCDCNSCKALRDVWLPAKFKLKRNYKHKCELCKKTFSRKVSLKKHEESKCGTLKLFPCDYCATGFTTKSCLQDHTRKFHSTSVSETKIKLTCDLCDKKFSSKNGLYRHKKNIHFLQRMNVTHTCEICQKAYKNQSGLDHHRLNIHIDDKFECGHCSEVYNSKNKLRKHIQSAHFQTHMDCSRPGCGRTFSSALGLKQHEKSFHKLSNSCFICETCGKAYGSKKHLLVHITIHTGEKPHTCHVCGKSFRTWSNLEQHSRTHSDKRPFSCDHCFKTFRIKHHLRQHMAVHGMAHTSAKRKQRNN